MALIRKEVIDNATLYCGDCLEILPEIGKVSAVLTDPPYGIGNFVQNTGNVRGEAVTWNDAPPAEEIFRALNEMSALTVIWGANYFNCFDGFRGALVWDKDQPMPNFSQAEIASYTWGKKTHLFRHQWTNYQNTKVSVHPCERPVVLYEWCLGLMPYRPDVVLDPFMGSGSVGVACMNQNMNFIGIEIEPKYFDIACERIDQAQRQQRLFA